MERETIQRETIRGREFAGAALLRRFLLLTTMLPAAPVFAQDFSSLLPSDFDAYHHSGPLAWRGVLTVHDLGYTDNVLSRRSNRVSDYTGTLSPQLEFFISPGTRSLVTARQTFDSTLYVDSSFLNTLGSSTFLSADLLLAHAHFRGVAGYDTARARPIEQLDIRPRRSDLNVQASASFEHGMRLATELRGFVYDTSYQDDLREPFVSFRTLLNHRQTGGNVELSYRIFRKTRFTASAEEFTAHFDQADNPRESRWQKLLAGLRFDTAASISGSIRAGTLRVSPDQAGVPPFDGLALDGNLSYRAGGGVVLGAAASRDAQFAVYTNNPWLIRSSYSTSATWRVTPRWGLESGVELAANRFPEPAPSIRRDRDRRAYVGVSRQLSVRSRTGLRYTLFRRNSNVDAFDLSTSTILATVAYVF